MIFAFIAAAAISMLLAPVFIPMLRRLKFGQVERKEGPHANSAKEGTPTMGGIMFIISIVVAAAVFSIYNIALSFSIPAILMMLAFGLVGFLDDFIKVRLKRNLGLKAYQKIIAQLLLSFAVAYYAYTISRTGSYLSECGGIPEGTPIAYLIAPPVEAQYGMDAALKAADVRMCAYFEPPSETNFSGGYLTGTQSACKAACDAFADAVVFCVENPLKY